MHCVMRQPTRRPSGSPVPCNAVAKHRFKNRKLKHLHLNAGNQPEQKPSNLEENEKKEEENSNEFARDYAVYGAVKDRKSSPRGSHHNFHYDQQDHRHHVQERPASSQ